MFWYCVGGGLLGFICGFIFILALCQVAGNADAHIEMMQDEVDEITERRDE